MVSDSAREARVRGQSLPRGEATSLKVRKNDPGGPGLPVRCLACDTASSAVGEAEEQA